MYISKQRQ